MAIGVLVLLVIALMPSALAGTAVFGSGDILLTYPPFSLAARAGFAPVNPILTDPVQSFVPDLLMTRRDLAAGVAPLWNSLVGAGRPLLASVQHAPLFPLNWLALVASFFGSLAWVAAGKILLAGWGTYLYGRRLSLRPSSALLAAVSFGFGMYFVVWLEHPHTFVWLCLPWMFLATHAVTRDGGPGAIALLAAATGATWLGGHPESSAMVLFVTTVYAGFELAAAARAAEGGEGVTDRPGRSARALRFAAGIALGCAIGSVTEIPLLELARQSDAPNRGGPGLPLKALYSFVFPELWGSPTKFSNAAGPINFNERTAYVGAMPLLLALGGLGRRRPARQWFFLGLTALALLIAFDTPVVGRGIRALPGGTAFVLWRTLIFASFGLAMLAGYGLDRLLDADGGERRRVLGRLALVAALPPLLYLGKHPSLLDHFGQAVGQLPAIHRGTTGSALVAVASVWRWVAVCAIGIGAVALLGRRARATAALTASAVIAVTGADLVTLDHGYHGSVSGREVDPPVPAPISWLAAHQGQQRFLGADYSLPPSTNERWGLRDARVGNELPIPRRYSDLWAADGGTTGDVNFLFVGTARAHLLADTFAVRYVFLAPGSVAPAWLRTVARFPGGTVAENATALPRAWVAYAWRSALDRRQALRMTAGSTTAQLAGEPVIEGAPPPPPGRGSAASPSPARVTDTSSQTVTVDATAARPGYLVLDDSSFPGWHATVDGRAVPWRSANENFRAVRLPAGRHTVVFRYRPASVAIGAVLAAVALLVTAGLALAARRDGPRGVAVLSRLRPRGGAASRWGRRRRARSGDRR